MISSFVRTQCDKIKNIPVSFWGWCSLPLTAYLYIALIVFFYAKKAFLYFSVFPKGYPNQELMLSYANGFIRRGLLGEVAFFLSDLISAKLFLTLIVFLGYSFFALELMRLLRGVLPPCRYWPVLVCSMLLGYATLNPLIYNRKSIFGLVCVLVCMRLIACTYRRVSFSLNRLFAVTVVCCLSVAITALVYEGVLFFAPTLFVCLGMLYARQKKLKWWAGIMFFIFAAVCAFAYFSSGVPDTLSDVLEQTWRSFYPSYNAGRPAEYLNGKQSLWIGGILFAKVKDSSVIPKLPAEFSQNFDSFVLIWKHYILYSLVPKYLTGLVLLAAGFAVVFAKPLCAVSFHEKIPSLLVWLFWGSLFVPFLLFLTSDWGRWLSEILFFWIIVACCVLKSDPEYRIGFSFDRRLDGDTLSAIGYVFLFCFLGSWYLPYCVEEEKMTALFSVDSLSFFVILFVTNRAFFCLKRI